MAALRDPALEHLHDAMTADRGIDLDRQAGPCEVIDDRQQAHTPAVQDIQHEVQRPPLVRAGRPGGWGPAQDPAPAAAPYSRAFLAVQARDSFEIDAVAFTAEQDMQPAIPKAPPFGGQDP
jgi:hypothetical protein